MRNIDLLTPLVKRDKTFTFEEAVKISGLPRNSLKKMIYRLEHKRAIERIEKGKYQIMVKVIDVFGNDTNKVLKVKLR